MSRDVEMMVDRRRGRSGRRAWLAIICTGALAACLHPRASSPPGPRSASLAGRIDSVFSRYEMYGFSGSVALSRDGRTLIERGYGLADRERAVPVTPSTRFDVASITKTFTAAAILRLAAAGRLRPTDPIHLHLGPVPPGKQQITIHQLLTHTSGFPLDPANAGIAPADTRAQFVNKAMGARLVSAPGAEHHYSNLGYGLLALIVERAAGEPFQEFVTASLLRPNRLRHTGWWSDSAAMAVPGAARGYLPGGEDTLEAEVMAARGGPDSPSWGKHPLGATGLISTPGDLQRWYRALAHGDVLPDSLRRLMLTPHVADEGYGWHVGEKQGVGKRIYRGGLRGPFSSLLAGYSDPGIVFAYTSNQATGWPSLVWADVERLIAGDPVALPPPTVTIGEERLAALAGDYRLPGGGMMRVWIESGVLVAGAEGQPAITALLGDAGGALRNADSLSSVAVFAVQSMLSGDTAGLPAITNPAALRGWLRAREAGGPIEALGTAPHPSGMGRVQSFLRVGRAGGKRVVRLIWQGGRIIAWGEGVRLPALERYRTVSDSTAVAFRPGAGVLRTLEFGRADAAGGVATLTVRRPDGSASATAQRIGSSPP